MEAWIASYVLAEGDTFSINASRGSNADNSFTFVNTFSSRGAGHSSWALVRICALSGVGDAFPFYADISTAAPYSSASINTLSIKTDFKALTLRRRAALPNWRDAFSIHTFPSVSTRDDSTVSRSGRQHRRKFNWLAISIFAFLARWASFLNTAALAIFHTNNRRPFACYTSKSFTYPSSRPFQGTKAGVEECWKDISTSVEVRMGAKFHTAVIPDMVVGAGWRRSRLCA